MEIKILEDRIQNSYLGDKNIATIIKKFIYGKVIERNEDNVKEEYSIYYNKKHGEYKKWYRNGVLAIKCTYNYGKIEGECKEWYDNGKLDRQRIYKDGIMNGEYKKWQPNGELRIECYYKDGYREGVYRSWKRGVLTSYCMYVKGELFVEKRSIYY